MNKIILNNYYPIQSPYFPRLQVNKRGEIVLATSKDGGLTTGILVGMLPSCTSDLVVGKVLVDWECGGELIDYDGDVAVTLTNRMKTGDSILNTFNGHQP